MPVTPDDIDRIHRLIDQHVRHSMTKSDIVASMSENFNIAPEFTELVWKQLEKENTEFFRAYNLRLELISQIKRFNELLERQARLRSRQAPVNHSESVSSSGSVLSTAHSVNFGDDTEESSCGSTTTPTTDANVQNSGEKQDNESGGSDSDTSRNN